MGGSAQNLIFLSQSYILSHPCLILTTTIPEPGKLIPDRQVILYFNAGKDDTAGSSANWNCKPCKAL